MKVNLKSTNRLRRVCGGICLSLFTCQSDHMSIASGISLLLSLDCSATITLDSLTVVSLTTQLDN